MKLSKGVKSLIIALFWLLLWHIVAAAVARPLLLPTPVETVWGFMSLAGDAGFYLDILYTILRCISAILLALVFGTALSLLSYRFGIVRDILSVPVSFFKAVPIMAVAIYMILVLSSGSVPVLVCFIMCFPIVYTNLLTGLDNMDDKYREMAVCYGFSGANIVRFIYWPQIYPHFKSALSLIAGMSWKAVVTAEVLSIPNFSLGYELMNAKYYLKTDILFAYVITIIAVSMVFEKLVRFLLDRFDAHDVKEYSGSKLHALSAERSELASTSAASHPELTSTSAAPHLEKSEAVYAPRIEFVNIDKSFGDKHVLSGFNAVMESGKTTAIMAASGAGKTTLMRILAGLEKSDGGEIVISPPQDKIAVLFQEDRLLPWLNVYDNLAIITGSETYTSTNTRRESNAVTHVKSGMEIRGNTENRIHSMLERVGLSEEVYKMPEQLSGGMSHRVALARAFLYDAKLMAMDEPFRGLDDRTRTEVIEKVWKPGVSGRTVMLITHDPEMAETLADKVIDL